MELVGERLSNATLSCRVDDNPSSRIPVFEDYAPVGFSGQQIARRIHG